MTDWENSYAASLMYQDLADCSLGSVPVSTELGQTKVAANEIEHEKQKVIVANILKKASVFLFLIMTLVITV